MPQNREPTPDEEQLGRLVDRLVALGRIKTNTTYFDQRGGKLIREVTVRLDAEPGSLRALEELLKAA